MSIPVRVVVAVVGLMCAAHAETTTQISKDEFRCQSAVRAALAKQAASHARCVQQCENDAAKTGGPYADCAAPYGGATARCLNDGGGAAGHGAENRSLATMLARCPEDGAKDSCPESYEHTFGSCAQMAATRVSDDHGTFSLFTSAVVCEHPNLASDPEAKRKMRCIRAVAKAAVAEFGAITKLFEKCNAAIVKGKLQPGACVPGATVSAKLSPGNTVPKVLSKTAAAIDTACFVGAAVAPPCYDGSALHPSSGTGWAAVIATISQSTVNDRTFVASASGAFVE